MKKAIVTLTVGAPYLDRFNRYSRASWKLYCEKFNYDLRAITQLPDRSERASRRSPAWQKLLLLSQDWSRLYDRIIWLDSDIVINNAHSYDVCLGVPEEKVGAVEEYSIPSRELHEIALARLYRYWEKRKIPFLDNKTPASYYMNRGLAGAGLSDVVQTGVLVCSPKHHREIFERVYNQYEDTHGSEWNYEMPALSYALLKADIVHWISTRFNFVVPSVLAAFYPEFFFRREPASRVMTKLQSLLNPKTDSQYLKNIYDLSIFMHFAGCHNLISRLRP